MTVTSSSPPSTSALPPPLVICEGFLCATSASTWGAFAHELHRGQVAWEQEEEEAEQRRHRRQRRRSRHDPTPSSSSTSPPPPPAPRRRVILAPIGPVSSLHDRACELFYALRGGTVDYGREHARRHGHARFGRRYEAPLLPGWGQRVGPSRAHDDGADDGDDDDDGLEATHAPPECRRDDGFLRAHFLGHSMGGSTVLKLRALLAQGFFDDALAIHASDDAGIEADDGREYGDGQAGPVDGPDAVSRTMLSVTTVSSPLRGTPLVHVLGTVPNLAHHAVRKPSVGDALAKLCHVVAWSRAAVPWTRAWLPDLRADAWPFARLEGGVDEGDEDESEGGEGEEGEGEQPDRIGATQSSASPSRCHAGAARRRRNPQRREAGPSSRLWGLPVLMTQLLRRSDWAEGEDCAPWDCTISGRVGAEASDVTGWGSAMLGYVDRGHDQRPLEHHAEGAAPPREILRRQRRTGGRGREEAHHDHGVYFRSYACHLDQPHVVRRARHGAGPHDGDGDAEGEGDSPWTSKLRRHLDFSHGPLSLLHRVLRGYDYDSLEVMRDVVDAEAEGSDLVRPLAVATDSTVTATANAPTLHDEIVAARRGATTSGVSATSKRTAPPSPPARLVEANPGADSGYASEAEPANPLLLRHHQLRRGRRPSLADDGAGGERLGGREGSRTTWRRRDARAVSEAREAAVDAVWDDGDKTTTATTTTSPWPTSAASSWFAARLTSRLLLQKRRPAATAERSPWGASPSQSSSPSPAGATPARRPSSAQGTRNSASAAAAAAAAAEAVLSLWRANDGVVPFASQFHPGPCRHHACHHVDGLPSLRRHPRRRGRPPDAVSAAGASSDLPSPSFKPPDAHPDKGAAGRGRRTRSYPAALLEKLQTEVRLRLEPFASAVSATSHLLGTQRWTEPWLAASGLRTWRQDDGDVYGGGVESESAVDDVGELDEVEDLGEVDMVGGWEEEEPLESEEEDEAEAKRSRGQASAKSGTIRRSPSFRHGTVEHLTKKKRGQGVPYDDGASALSQPHPLPSAQHPDDAPHRRRLLPRPHVWHVVHLAATSHTSLCPLWTGSPQQLRFWRDVGAWLRSVEVAEALRPPPSDGNGGAGGGRVGSANLTRRP